MKTRIQCPGCGQGYLLDASTVDGKVVCPACCAEIPVKSSIPLSPGEPEIIATAIDTPAQPTAAEPPVEPKPAQPEVAAAPPPSEVVCPRCNLHFSTDRSRPGQPSLGGAKPKVLIVEDQSYFRQIAEDALTAEYEVLTATNIIEALDVLRQGGIALVVLDLTLGGGDTGLELLRAMEKVCPILIYTAKDESELYGDEWDELRKLGADDIVMKGMHVGDALVQKVGTLLGRTWDEEEDLVENTVTSRE